MIEFILLILFTVIWGTLIFDLVIPLADFITMYVVGYVKIIWRRLTCRK